MPWELSLDGALPNPMAAGAVTKLLKDYSRQVMGFWCGFQCRYVPQLVGTVQVGEDGEMVEVNGARLGIQGHDQG